MWYVYLPLTIIGINYQQAIATVGHVTDNFSILIYSWMNFKTKNMQGRGKGHRWGKGDFSYKESQVSKYDG